MRIRIVFQIILLILSLLGIGNAYMAKDCTLAVVWGIVLIQTLHILSTFPDKED